MQNVQRWSGALILALLTVGACSAETERCLGGREEGETWKDGCNDCVCNADGSITCNPGTCDIACQHEGQSYPRYAVFPAGDGCNVCMCEGNGMVSCTQAECGMWCVYAGQQREPGSSFPARDGCNTCTCQPSGTIACTEMDCPCDPPSEWWRQYQSTDPVECTTITFSCPPGTELFDNTCGCGCEQDPKCAEQYDCRPPNECDVAMLELDCPFSVIVTE